MQGSRGTLPCVEDTLSPCNEADDAAVAANSDKRARDTPLSGSHAQNNREKVLMANLMLYSPSQRGNASWVGGIWSIDPKEQKEFTSLAEMAKLIGQQQALDQLLIYAHGFPGGFVVETPNDAGERHGYNFSDEAISKAFANSHTKIDHIRFEGCWVGEAPNEMAVFGRLFNAQDVSGYNWTHFTNEAKVTIPKGATADDLKSAWKSFWKWVVPYPPRTMQQLASLAQQRDVKMVLPLEWYKYEDDDTDNTLPPSTSFEGSNKGQNIEITDPSYKARWQASKRTVPAKDAKHSSNPSPPFEYVTVQLR
jgi:hypothetical protein